MAENSNAVMYDIFKLGNEKSLKSKKLILDLTERRLQVLNVVESLSSVLTDEDKTVRLRGVDYLTWLLTELPVDYLNEKEISYFADFYCDRLKDHHSITPSALSGLLSIVKMTFVSDKSVQHIMHQLFQLVTCQAQMADDRFTIYNIVKYIGELHYSAVKAVGADLLYGFITSMEGETDPRNLLFIFSFCPNFLRQFDFAHLTNDVFEVFSTYFPVDFTSVTKDDLVITREDLAENLRECLTATDRLAAECIPLILEKLDSTLKIAKIDSYKLLQSACKRLHVGEEEQSLNLLWKMIQKDVLPPLHPAVQEEALKGLTCIVGALSKNIENESATNRFLDDVIISVRSLIAKPDDSLFLPAMKVLLAVCPMSSIGARRSLLELQYLCRTKFKSEVELCSLLSAMLPFIPYATEDNPVLESIFTLSIESTKHEADDVCLSALFILSKMSKIILQNSNYRELIYSTILHILLKEKESKASNESLQVLRCLATEHPEEVEVSVFAMLESAVKSRQLQSEHFLRVCSSLCDIARLTPRIVEIFIQSCTENDTSETALNILLKACQNSLDSSFKATLDENFKMICKITPYWMANKTPTQLVILAQFIKEIVSSLSSESQEQLITSNLMWTIFCRNDISLLSALQNSGALRDSIAIVLEGIFGSLRREVSVPYLTDLTEQLVSVCVASDCSETRQSVGRLLATFVNKYEIVPTNIMDVDRKDRCVALKCWILKGSVMKGLPTANLDEWFSGLAHPELSCLVAEGTRLLVRNEEVFLNESCHCVARLFYRQRLFNYVPQLLHNFSSAEPALRNNYLAAAVALTEGVTKAVWLLEEAVVGRLVAQALLSQDPSVAKPGLDILRHLLEDSSTIFTNNSTTILPALLRLSCFPDNMKVRCQALQCLFLAGCYPTHLTLPYKTEVVKSLGSCLADKKRLVRSEAARARSRWYLIGAVGEDSVFPASS